MDADIGMHGLDFACAYASTSETTDGENPVNLVDCQKSSALCKPWAAQVIMQLQGAGPRLKRYEDQQKGCLQHDPTTHSLPPYTAIHLYLLFWLSIHWWRRNNFHVPLHGGFEADDHEVFACHGSMMDLALLDGSPLLLLIILIYSCLLPFLVWWTPTCTLRL